MDSNACSMHGRSVGVTGKGDGDVTQTSTAAAMHNLELKSCALGFDDNAQPAKTTEAWNISINIYALREGHTSLLLTLIVAAGLCTCCFGARFGQPSLRHLHGEK
jgi:hypothetical protein